MTTPIHPPVSGRWAWREYLPTSTDEWLELRNRVIELRPAGVDVLRFSDWVLAEMRDQSPPSSGHTLAKYRKLLHELATTAPPSSPARATKTRNRSVAARRSNAAAGTKGRAVAEIATGRRVAASAAPKKGRDLTPRIPADESYVESVGFERLAA